MYSISPSCNCHHKKRTLEKQQPLLLQLIKQWVSPELFCYHLVTDGNKQRQRNSWVCMCEMSQAALPFVMLFSIYCYQFISIGKRDDKRFTGNLNKRKSGVYTLKWKWDNNTLKLFPQFCKTLSKRPYWHRQNKRKHFLL